MSMLKTIVVLFIFSSVNLFAQPNQTVDREVITQMLYQYGNDDIPGMAVGVVKEGKIIYEHYLGYANLEHKVKIDKDTRFNIASDAKQFTAICILKLAEQGEIDINDDFREYLPDIYNNISDKITISNLITHTSGIRDYGYLIGLTGKTTWKQFTDNDDVIALLKDQKDLNFKPGTQYLYSNSNYILLTEIVKSVTGQEFGVFSDDMFMELGMLNTSFMTNYMAIIPHKARPYSNWNGWREEPNIGDVHGDGGLFTNLQDQLKWEQIVQLNDETYFSKKFINKSQSPLITSIDGGYGYGLEFGQYGGLKYTYHDGSTGAYNATFFRFPAEKVSIVVITNNRNVPTNYLAQLIADYVLKLPSDSSKYPRKPKEVEPLKNPKDLVGTYQNESNGTIIKIVEKGEALYRERYKQDPVKLIAQDGALFEYETRSKRINFTNIGQANQEFTLYHPSIKPETYRKLSIQNSRSFDKKELNGNFYNEETGTNITLQFIEGNTYVLTKNGKERKAQLILDDHLRMNTYLINTIRDEENKVIGLNVNNNRIRNVVFTKK
ncbi:MAG: serine hydrolase domain-containing protein [Bacteroidota bacterium]